MGCQCSKREPDEEVSHQIDIEMKEEKVRLAKEVKILLLGSSLSLCVSLFFLKKYSINLV